MKRYFTFSLCVAVLAIGIPSVNGYAQDDPLAWLDELYNNSPEEFGLTREQFEETKDLWREIYSEDFLRAMESPGKIRNAAHNGVREAQFFLGASNTTGSLHECDVCSGIKWLSHAALQRLQYAYLFLAEAYIEGYGVIQDLELGCYALVRESEMSGTRLFENVKKFQDQMKDDTDNPNST